MTLNSLYLLTIIALFGLQGPYIILMTFKMSFFQRNFCRAYVGKIKKSPPMLLIIVLLLLMYATSEQKLLALSTYAKKYTHIIKIS